jgi:hypothetical protein
MHAAAVPVTYPWARGAIVAPRFVEQEAEVEAASEPLARKREKKRLLGLQVSNAEWMAYDEQLRWQ